MESKSLGSGDGGLHGDRWLGCCRVLGGRGETELGSPEAGDQKNEARSLNDLCGGGEDSCQEVYCRSIKASGGLLSVY